MSKHSGNGVLMRDKYTKKNEKLQKPHEFLRVSLFLQFCDNFCGFFLFPM